MPRPRNPKQLVACPHCGTQFYATQQRLTRAQTTPAGIPFCSNRCAGRYHSAHGLNKPPVTQAKIENTVETTCAQCGKSMTLAKHLVTRRKYGVFCNHECYGKWRTEKLSGENSPAWKGGNEVWYEGNWKSQRAKARRRDQHTCQDCGVTEQEWGYELDVHHVIPYDMFSNPHEANELSNLVTLCRPCHTERHSTESDWMLFEPKVTYVAG